MNARDDDKAEHPIYALGAGAGMILVMGFLVWLVASNRIVYGSLRPALFLGAMWKLFEWDYGYTQWNYIVKSVEQFAYRPSAVSIVDWGGFMTVVLRPIAIVGMAAYIGFLVALGSRKKAFMRRFDAESLMRMTMREFTGVAPIAAIRKLIARDQHPLWRTQVAPEEIFNKYRVPNVQGAAQLAPVGAPMVREGRFDRDVARNYFTGITGHLGQGRVASAMLGRQLVNLPTDAAKASSFVFADRMTSEGKTLLALWAAVAFNGKEGRDEFCKYRDMLNLSAYGTRDGIANLSVAQPLYQKYRTHPTLNRLFAIHHWEHTVLFQLLSMAQKKGRFTTAEVLWLRPTNRIMYFALNSRGSATPHTEAASTFAMHAYEVLCARNKRMPLYRDEDGALRHMIYVEKAIDGLAAEWAHWFEADDDEGDDWWLSKDMWQSANGALQEEFAKIAAAAPKAEMPGWHGGRTTFDSAVARQAGGTSGAAAPGTGAPAGGAAADDSNEGYVDADDNPDLSKLFR